MLAPGHVRTSVVDEQYCDGSGAGDLAFGVDRRLNGGRRKCAVQKCIQVPVFEEVALHEGRPGLRIGALPKADPGHGCTGETQTALSGDRETRLESAFRPYASAEGIVPQVVAVKEHDDAVGAVMAPGLLE